MKMSKTTAELPLAVAASQLTNPTMQGYLEKKRPSKKLLSVKYQKRWCLVYGKYFFYYNSPDDKVQNGTFSLEGYRFLSCPGNGPFGFSLLSKHKRSFEFMASSQEDYVKWEEAIKKGLSLTLRVTEPIRVKKEHKCATDGSKQKTETLRKCVTLPNLNTPKRQQFATHTLHNTIDCVDGNECPDSSVKNAQWSQITSTSEPRNQFTSKVPSSIDTQNDARNLIQNLVGEEHESTDNSDDDDDGSGYILTGKLNCPKLDRTVDTSNTLERKSYTEDDYMMVLSDQGTSTQSSEDPYMEVNTAENNKIKQGIEKLYSSVKRPDASITLSEKNERNPYASTAELRNQITSKVSFSIDIQNGARNLLQNREDKEHENTDDSDDDDDGSGYIHAAKLNCPKLDRTVDTLNTPERKSYTEDDYMSVLSDQGTSTQSSEDPYMEVNTAENNEIKQGIEKIYCSVKRPEASITFSAKNECNPYAEFNAAENDETKHGKEFIYTSIKRTKAVGHFRHVSSSDSEDDYAQPHEIISCSKLTKHSENLILDRLSGDYERVDTFLPVRKFNDTSSSDNEDSDADDNDYELPQNITQTAHVHSQIITSDRNTATYQHPTQNNQRDLEAGLSSSENDISSLTIVSNGSQQQEPIYENY